MNKKLLSILTAALVSASFAAPNPNFHIYIAYGQSNMAGAGPIENGDQDVVDNFLMLSGIDCTSRKGNTNIQLRKGEWAKAVPPMFHCYEGLSVADYFGKTMAKELPGITIGIIPVAVGGASIKLFDKDQWQSYINSEADWMKNWARDYDPNYNDYGAIISLAKKAQEVGVIKGMIFHQGETDGGMSNWEQIVKKTYSDMLNELGLREADVPFVAGEMVYNGACHGMSARVRGLSQYFIKFGVAASQGTGMQSDRLHFDHDGYVEMGKRYAAEMLKLIDKTVDPSAPPVNVEDPSASTLPDLPPEEPGPFMEAIKIPGKVEAENYDKGGEGSAYHDTDKINEGDEYRVDGVDIVKQGMGLAVGYTQTGEWLKYSVSIEEDGDYEVIANVASGSTGSSFVMYLDDDAISEEIVAPSGTDWDTYTEVSGGTVHLKAGEYALKIEIGGPYINIDWVEFKAKMPTDKIRLVPESLRSLEMAQVFDLRGKYLGNIKLVHGENITHVLKAQGYLSGIYVVRQNGLFAKIRLSK